MMAEDKRYILAKFALEQGDRFQARDLLSDLLKEEPGNIEYWLLLSTVVESNKERIYCLNKVLEIDPRNEEAHLGMVLFGAVDPGSVRPADVKKRDWNRDLPDIRKKVKGKEKTRKSRYNYKQLIPLGVGAFLILLVLVLGGVLPGTRSIFSPRLTITPITWTPEGDSVQANALTGTPDPILRVPIGKVLDAPYTPTPAYVLTPHSGYGTYQTALDAYSKGDFETMLTYMRQTEAQLETPDVVYLVGEALRNLGRYTEALEKYERALFLDSAFAPAYYGRALINQALDPAYDIKGDLDQALLLDPGYGEVYLARAAYYLDQGAYQLAYEDASQALAYLSQSPIANYYQAAALLELKDYEEAERAIITALQYDINYVPSYLVYGRVSLELGKANQALDLLTRYEPYDPDKGWDFYYALGKALFLTQTDYTGAIELLDRAVALGGASADLYQTRSLILTELEQYDLAVQDAFKARDYDRESFDPNLFLAVTLFENQQYSLALVYLNIAEGLAFDDGELAYVYYWRALTYEELNRLDAAVVDWQSLLDLPRIYVPDEWEFIAAEKLVPTFTPTPTETFTPTLTPTDTPTPQNTPTPSGTPPVTETPEPTP